MKIFDNLRAKQKANLGTLDRTLRIIIAVAIALGIFISGMEGWIIIIPLLLAVYLLFTANIAFCPLYKLVGWSTEKENRQNS